jgi:hypothetical protein
MSSLVDRMTLNCRGALSARACVLAAAVLIGLETAAAASDYLSNPQRSAAVSATARGNRACSAAKPFYWEIGDQNAPLISGTEGAALPTASTTLPISSASEWIFAAYVLQSHAGKLSDSEISPLTMRSGYSNLQFDRCVQRSPGSTHLETVNNCFHALHLVGGSNSDFKPAQVGKFFYNGGHFQRLAATDPRLGELTGSALTRVIGAQLGTGVAFIYDSPQLDAGIRTTPASYAWFLRKILANQLLMHDALGGDAVCTNPSRCPTALNTPIPQTESWHYSLGHWVEDDPRVGDGAFSDPGLMGFYPWIDASKTYYGVLARTSHVAGAHVSSMQCGRLIRKAWLTGKSQ